MIKSWLQEIVPRQQTGMKSDTESKVSLKQENDAVAAFATVSERLLTVNQWHQYAGTGTASFQLTDAGGNPVNRQVKKGDYFRIDIPGPGNTAGGNGDWVQVQATGTKTGDRCQLTYITVRAASSPLGMKDETAHFFENAATSTFVAFRDNLKVTAGVYGRNERPNVNSRSILNRIRNWLVYVGAQLGMSKLQWKSLTDGLVKQLG